MISNLGILLWMVTASVTLFSSFHLKRGVSHPEGASFLRWVAVLSLMLMCDDLLMLHEQVFPQYLHVSEKMVYVFYLAYTSLFLLKFWRLILSQANYKLLILAFFFFGMSVIIDMEMFPGGIDIEDSFKILGLTTYTYYFVTLSSDWLTESLG